MPAGVVRDGSNKNAAPQMNSLVASLPTAARRRSLSANCAPLKRIRTEDAVGHVGQGSAEDSLGAQHSRASLSTNLSKEQIEAKPDRLSKDRVAVNVFCFNTVEPETSQEKKPKTVPSTIPLAVPVVGASREKTSLHLSAANVMRASAPASNVWVSGDQKKNDSVNDTRKKFLQDLTARMQLCLARIQECRVNGDEQNLEKYQELVKTLREQMDKVMKVRQPDTPNAKRARCLV